MQKEYEVRFWNKMNENMMMLGKYSHWFYTYDDAFCWASENIEWAYLLGAVGMDINCEFYPIICEHQRVRIPGV